MEEDKILTYQIKDEIITSSIKNNYPIQGIDMEIAKVTGKYKWKNIKQKYYGELYNIVKEFEREGMVRNIKILK